MDKKLVEELTLGSHESFAMLYDKWVSHLHRFVLSIVKSSQSTEDIVQETFVTIWSNRSTLKADSSFKTYLFTIAYHRAIKELRKNINQPSMEDYLEYTSNLVYEGETTSQMIGNYSAPLQFFQTLHS